MKTLRKHGTARAMATMVSSMLLSSWGYAELAAFTGMKPNTVSAWIRELKRAGLVYIARWENDQRGYPTIACYAWGPGKHDCKKPTLTAAERARLFRLRQKGVMQ